MSGSLATVLEGYLELRRRLDPVAAGAAGWHELDGQLAAWDRDSVRAMTAAVRSYASSLEELDAETLDDEIDRTAALHAARHDLLVLERERPFAHNPALHLAHAIEGIARLAAQLPDVPERSAALVARVRALPEFLAATREAVKQPVPMFVEEAGELVPVLLAMLRDELADVPLDPAAAGPDEWEMARAAGVDAVLALRDWLTIAAEDAGGHAAIGRDLFERKLHTAHMIQEGAVELARYGERLRDEAEEELRSAAGATSPGLDWREAVARLRESGTSSRATAAACAASLAAAVASQRRPVRRQLGTPAAREGWTLYCEGLVAEHATITTPEQRLLTAHELLRCAHLLLLDVALHARDASPASEERRLADALALPEREARALVRRAAAWPTMLSCAAAGRREILRLRDDARRARGAAWSAPAFHGELLGFGALPTALARWGMGLA